MTLIEFLLARLKEDEWAAYNVPEGDWERALAEVEAKRAIVARVQMSMMRPPQISDHAADRILRALASVYRGHKDYREEWAL